MSYVLNYYDTKENLAYTVNLSNDTTTPKINYVLSNRTDSTYMEGIPTKLLSLGYAANEDDLEFPWKRDGYFLKISMRVNGVDVTVKKGDKTTSFFHKYSTDLSEFRRLLLESEIEVSS